MAERLLERWTDGLLFESAYAADRYRAQIGRPNCPTSVVVNGVGAADLVPVVPQAGATDVLFVGELRRLKGVDVLLAALALANASRPVTATIVGDGPDAEQFRQQTAALGLETRVVFTGALPAVEAWPLGHVFVLPSRAESLPYVLLEAGGRELPIITTRVGGIPQLVEKTGTPLVNPGDAYALAAALLDTLGDPVSARQRAAALRTRIAEVYSIHAMADGVLGFYAALRAARRGPAASPRPLSVEP
jgi:glycosyltransferase involved in cell wall biosynthesis